MLIYEITVSLRSFSFSHTVFFQYNFFFPYRPLCVCRRDTKRKMRTPCSQPWGDGHSAVPSLSFSWDLGDTHHTCTNAHTCSHMLSVSFKPLGQDWNHAGLCQPCGIQCLNHPSTSWPWVCLFVLGFSFSFRLSWIVFYIQWFLYKWILE